jgi:hypothetical protein
VEEILTAEVLAANADAEVLAAEESPAYKLDDTVQSMTLATEEQHVLVAEDQVLTTEVLVAEVHILAAEHHLLAVEDQVLTTEVLVAEVHILAAEHHLLAVEDKQVLVAEDDVQDLAQEEVPGRQAAQDLAREEVPGGQAIQDLNQEENLGHQAAQDLAREEVPDNTESESREDIFPGHNAANAGKTSLDGKVGGIRSDPPEVVGEDNAGNVKTMSAVRSPVCVFDASTADVAEEPEDIPEDKAVNGGGEHAVQGERDRVCDPQCETPDDGGGAGIPTVHNEDNCVGEEEEVIDVDVWHDAIEDKIKAGPIMSQKTSLGDFKLDDGGVRLTDVTKMPEKRGKAETPTIVQREYVHKAIAGQEATDPDGSDDRAAAASRDGGDEVVKFPDEGIQKRPKKPPDDGCFQMKRVGLGMLKTGIILMHLLFMMEPMIIIAGPVVMNNYVGDFELHASEKEFVNTEENIMCDTGVVDMKTELCPTGGRDNILRYDKSVDGGGDAHVHISDQYDHGVDVMRGIGSSSSWHQQAAAVSQGTGG